MQRVWERSEVFIARRGGVALLTLNAPRRRNALVVGMADELAEGCAWLDAQEDIGAVVVLGAEGAFCAGADRALLARASEDPAESERFDAIGRIYQAFLRVGELRVPTIAAIRGAAVGAGFNLALVTDLRIVAHQARLISGFLPVGLHPGGGHLTLLARLVGPEAAAALAAFGQTITGTRAEQLGLAWEAVADEDVEERAVEIAAQAAADPELSRALIASLRVAVANALPLAAAVRAERGAQMWSMRRLSGS